MSAIICRTLITRLPTSTITRPLSTSIIRQKTVTETVKDTIDSVDKKSGKILAAGIEGAENATHTVKEKVSDVVGAARKNTPTAEEAKGAVKGKASEAQGKASEVAGEAKGKANEISGKAKGAFEEAKGKVNATEY
ncbi:hypothetical protein TWF970_005771 [Orbilia oligospora]|uniref:Uncharacterized protein n=1 Tax=Orbilia oligospora TaxID=2813651 RepID=A0A7C8RL02_ORBOL|nr:hypothetical protein TWF970_005771 [Orbilia oligospora]